MDFRLVYKGPLSAEGSSGGKATEKQRLRKHFHSQLRELWSQHPDLRSQAQSLFYKSDQGEAGTKIIQVEASLTTASNVKTWVDHIADDHQKCGGRFVPLISKANGFTCALDILFLRRDNPGHLIAHGGDIDNRIKVLLDGLRMPDTEGELGGLPLEDDENPFFCLLEDDRLITALSVTTDRLLMPVDKNEHVKHVFLVIHVAVQNPSALFAGGRLV